MKGSKVSVYQKDMTRDAHNLSRANAQNFTCIHLFWAVAEGEQSELDMCDENLGLVALGRKLKGQPSGCLC